MKKITMECWACDGRGSKPMPMYGENIVQVCTVCNGEGKITAKVLSVEEE